MKNKYYLMMETRKNYIGYPVSFEYDLINCNREGWKSNCILNCPQKTIELRAKNPKLSFDLKNIGLDNYFVSDILWEVLQYYIHWELNYKKVEFFGKNKKKVATKNYIVFCFNNEYDKEQRYIDRLKSLYIVPNYKRKREAILIKPFINYEILNQFDILPSQFRGFYDCLVVSEKVKNNEQLKNTKLEFVPIEDAANLLLFSENGIAQKKFLVKDLDILKKQEPISGEKLLKNGYKNGKKITF